MVGEWGGGAGGGGGRAQSRNNKGALSVVFCFE